MALTVSMSLRETLRPYVMPVVYGVIIVISGIALVLISLQTLAKGIWELIWR